MSEATNRVLEAQLRRQKQHDKRQKEWESALKPTTIDGSGVLRQLGQQPLDNRQILPNTASLNRPIRPTAVPGGVVADWLPRVKTLEVTEERRDRPVVGLVAAYTVREPFGVYQDFPSIYRHGETTDPGLYTEPIYAVELFIYTENGKLTPLDVFENDTTPIDFSDTPFFSIGRPLASPLSYFSVPPLGWTGTTAIGDTIDVQMFPNTFPNSAFFVGLGVRYILGPGSGFPATETVYQDGFGFSVWAQRRILCDVALSGDVFIRDVATGDRLVDADTSATGQSVGRLGSNTGGRPNSSAALTNCSYVSRLTPSYSATAYINGRYIVWVWGWERDFAGGVVQIIVDTPTNNLRYMYTDIGEFFVRYEINKRGRFIRSETYKQSAGDTPEVTTEPFAADIQWGFSPSASWSVIGAWKKEGKTSAINTLGNVGNAYRLSLSASESTSFLREDLRQAIDTQTSVLATQTADPSGQVKTFRLIPPTTMPGRVSDVISLFRYNK